MANTVKIRNSQTTTNVPASLVQGELAINEQDELLFYRDGAGSVQSFDLTTTGGGDVSKVGTPVDNQIGVWTGDGTIEGDTAFTFDTSTNSLSLGGTTSGSTSLVSLAAASGTLTLPSATDQLVGRATTDTLTNKSIAAGSNTITGLVWDTNIFADGTDGQIPTFDASGEPAFVATGTSGQVLTSNGAGTAPTFQTPAGGSSGALTLLGTASASNSTSIDIGSGLDLDATIDGTYDHYILEAVGVVPATDAVDINIRLSTDGGSTFISTGDYDYFSVGGRAGTAASVFSQAINATVIKPNGFAVGNLNGESFNLRMTLYKPSDATLQTQLGGQLTMITSGSASMVMNFSAVEDTQQDIDAIRVFMSSGNITSGEFKLYGVQAS